MMFPDVQPSTPAKPSPERANPLAGQRRRSSPRHDPEAARREHRTIELLTRARDQDQSAAERKRCRELAIRINLPVADSLARRYRSRGESLEDLTQVARLGLVHATQRFDPDNGAFLSFAIPTITGEIKRHFRDHCWVVRPPRRLQELHSEVASAWADLAQERASTPTVAEVAESIGAERADVLEALRSNAFRSASLDTAEGLSTASATLSSADPGFEDVDDSAERDELVQRVNEACRQLSNDERRLLWLRFVQGLSQATIAGELEISQMSVSRRLKKVTLRLRAEVTERPAPSPVRQSMQRRANPVPRQPSRV